MEPGLHVRSVAQRFDCSADTLVGHLDRPVSGDSLAGYHLPLTGWVRPTGVEHLELRAGDEVVAQIAVDVPRPDLAPALGEQHASSGFAAEVGMLGRDAELRLELVVVATDGAALPVATIELTKAPLATPRTGPAPLIVTTVGRSGSSWICALLGSHPSILTYHPMQAEARVASYWSQIFADLIEPNTARLPFNPSPTGDLWWRWSATSGAAPLKDPTLERLVLPDHVRAVGEFCQQRVIATCFAMAEAASRVDGLRYFTEKCETSALPWMIWDLFPNAREIVLVRDLRDILASVLAFNRKRGFAAFGREQHETDEDYVTYVAGFGEALRTAFTSRGDRALIVRYEDLVGNLPDELQRILAYLDLDRDEATVTQMIDHTPDGAAASFHRTTVDARTSVGRWRTDLSRDLQDACATLLAEPVAALGYGP